MDRFTERWMSKSCESWDEFNEVLRIVLAARPGTRVRYTNPDKRRIELHGLAKFSKRRGRWYVRESNAEGSGTKQLFIDDVRELVIRVKVGCEAYWPNKTYDMCKELGFVLI